MKSLVSVIIAVYNGEKYIEKAIESVLQQSYSNIELIVVDDGSTDKTREIIKKFKVKYFYQKNQGQGKAKNLGIKESKGEYVAFLDADDIYLKNKIKKQVEFLVKNENVDVVYNNAILIDEYDNYTGKLSSEMTYDRREDFYAYSLFRQVIACPPTMMVRKTSLKNIKFPEGCIYAEDYKFILDMAEVLKFRSLNDFLYLYRRHNGNITNNHLKQLEAEINIVKNFDIKKITRVVNESKFSDLKKMYLLAKILMKIEENSLAKKLLIESEHKDEYAYFYIGNLNYIEKNLNQAKENYLKSIKINSSLAEVYNNLGIIECLLKNEVQAKIYFNYALSINRDYMDASYNLNKINNFDKTNEFKLTKRELRKQLTKYN